LSTLLPGQTATKLGQNSKELRRRVLAPSWWGLRSRELPNQWMLPSSLIEGPMWSQETIVCDFGHGVTTVAHNNTLPVQAWCRLLLLPALMLRFRFPILESERQGFSARLGNHFTPRDGTERISSCNQCIQALLALKAAKLRVVGLPLPGEHGSKSVPW